MIIYLQYGMTAIRMFLLLISVLGWLTYLRKEVRVEFALGILVTGIGSLMFAAGIFHIMKEAAWMVFLGGFWMLVREIRSFPDKKTGSSVRGDESCSHNRRRRSISWKFSHKKQ